MTTLLAEVGDDGYFSNQKGADAKGVERLGRLELDEWPLYKAITMAHSWEGMHAHVWKQTHACISKSTWRQ